ncbi:MAG: O-antigen ligase family protein [Armatimonadota bacterium]|nr:MAG: O-antigen ligase family protein [Armatimonadota bacterium]
MNGRPDRRRRGAGRVVAMRFPRTFALPCAAAPGLCLALALPGGGDATRGAVTALAVAAGGVLAVLLPVRWLLYGVILAIPFDNYAVPVGPLGISVSDALLVVVTLRWLLAVLYRRGRIARSELYAPAALFYVLLLPSFFVTFDLGLSLRQAFSILMMLLTAVVVANLLRGPGRLMGAATALLVGSAIMSLLGFAQLLVWMRYHVSPFQPNVDVVRLGGITFLRLTATYFDPNYFALYLIAPIVLGLFVALESGASRRYKTFAWLVVLADLALFVMTFSRGGWLTLLAFMGVYVLLRARARPRGAWVAMLVAVIIAAPLVAGVLVGINPTSVVHRLSLLQLGAEVMTEHPLTGAGLGTFRHLPENRLARPSHSTYLQIGADAGVIALLGFLCLALVVAVNAIRALRVARSEPTRAILLGTIYALGCLALQGSLLDALIAKYLWILVGMSSAAAAVARSERAADDSAVAARDAPHPVEQES